MSLFRSGTLERRRAGGLGQGYGRRSIIPGRKPIPFPTRKQPRITPQPRYMNVLPKPGDWCISLRGAPDYPLVCFDTYQEAYEFPADYIPAGQGYTTFGQRREIVCRANTRFDDEAFKQRTDAVIGKILSCADGTAKRLPTGW